MEDKQYAGFWIRFGASFIDSLLMIIIFAPLVTIIYGRSYWTDPQIIKGFWDVVVNYILPVLAIMTFWIYKSATPGKMVTKLIIVDAKTGGKPTLTQFVIRYMGYYVSLLPCFLGFLWAAFDRRKQAWHDKLAGTIVIKTCSE